MGSSFTNIHVRKNDSVKLSDVEKLLCDEFGKMGFSQVSDAASADETVLLCEADGSSWITVCSGQFERRLSELSTALKTDVMLIECVDSDFIEMTLVSADGKDARVTIGEPYYGERENSYSEWEGEVSDLEKFIEVTNGDYVFAEDALTHLDGLMGLPIVQGGMFGDCPPENGGGVTVKVLGFSVAKEPTDELPKLNIYHQHGMPATPGKSESFSIRNLGGASKGLSIVFLGDYIENDEITFTDCSLELVKNRAEKIPIELEKIKRDDGSYVLAWRGEDIDILPAPDKKLSYAKMSKLEYERSFIFRYTPNGNNRKFLDIRICVAPLQNLSGGQDVTYVWKSFGSKKEFIEWHNEWCSRTFTVECGYFPEDTVGIIREEDYDLD